MSAQATPEELAAAQEVARVVRGQAGELTVNVDELLATFGVTRLTIAARERMTHALAAEGITTTPSVTEVRRGESITLATQVARREFVKPTRTRPPGQARSWYRRPWGVTAIAVLVLFVLIGALSSDPESEKTEQAATTTATPTPTPTPTAVATPDATPSAAQLRRERRLRREAAARKRAKARAKARARARAKARARARARAQRRARALQRERERNTSTLQSGVTCDELGHRHPHPPRTHLPLRRRGPLQLPPLL